MTGLLSTITNGPVPSQGGLTPLGGRIAGYLGDYITGPIHRFYEANNTAVRSLLGGPPMTNEEIAKLADAMVEIMPEVGAITYHGTPHRFAPTLKNALGEFDLSKIGTGEGAQAYGHGIYVADSPDVAKAYRNELGTEIKVDGKPLFSGGKQVSTTGDSTIDDLLLATLGDVDKSLALAKQNNFDEYVPVLEGLRNKVSTDKGGSLYKVDLPDEHIEKMLDWDKPLSEQPKHIKGAFPGYENVDSSKIVNSVLTGENLNGFSISPRGEGYAAFADNDLMQEAEIFSTKDDALNWIREKARIYSGDNPLGSQLYRHLTRQYGQDGIGQAQASNELLNKGIPGIKFLDGFSRKNGEGLRNYVVFDPSILNILSRE